MYKQVETVQELAKFHEIKETVWTSMGFEMEHAKEGSAQFLLLAEDGEAGGTFEMTPFSKSSAYMKSLFQDVVTEDMKVMEVDSLAVLPKYRGQLGQKGICLMIDYAEKHGYTHAIGVADPTFFKFINQKYQVKATQTRDIVFYKGADAIPTLFHLKDVYDNKHDPKYSWYNSSSSNQVKVEVGG